MRLSSFGCSFIFGTDLSDCVTADPVFTPSAKTWPALMAEHLGMEYQCHAGGGRGNLMILDRLSQEIARDPDQLFVVQWTYIDRFDYSDPNGHHFNQGTNDYLSLLPGDDDVLSQFYFRNLHSEYRDKLTNLIYIKTATDMLLQNQCRFIMTSLDDLIWCDRFHAPSSVMAWQRYLRPHIQLFDGQNFLDWSKSNAYAISASGHPLEQAHAAAADYMLPVIGSILRRA